MKEIKLTQGKFALVDDEDFDRLNQYKWTYLNVGHACRGIYLGMNTDGKPQSRMVLMSREILNVSENVLVDHKNHNTLDNQKHNLRACTRQENNRNRKPNKATSIYKGVGWHKQNQKWRARIHTEDIFGQSIEISLGLFISEEEEAALAYDKAASFEFGEFAWLNFPQS